MDTNRISVKRCSLNILTFKRLEPSSCRETILVWWLWQGFLQQTVVRLLKYKHLSYSPSQIKWRPCFLQWASIGNSYYMEPGINSIISLSPEFCTVNLFLNVQKVIQTLITLSIKNAHRSMKIIFLETQDTKLLNSLHY